MQPEDTTPDSAPTPGNTPGTHTAHTAPHTPNPTDTPAAPEPGSHTATDAATPTPEPDSRPQPRHDAPASLTPNTHPNTPATSPEPAHATTDGKHAAQAHNATPAKRKSPTNYPSRRAGTLIAPPTPLTHIHTDAITQLAHAAGITPPDNAGPDAWREAVRGVESLEESAPERAAIYLATLAIGGRHREAFIAAGLSQVDVMGYARVSEGFGKLYDVARRVQGQVIAGLVLDAALTRAVDGVDEPIIGRVGKDEDGVITHRKRHSDKLAEVLLRGTDPRFREAAATTQTAQTIYNIQVLHRDGPGHAPDDQAPAKVGGKTAAKQQQESQVIDAEALTLD